MKSLQIADESLWNVLFSVINADHRNLSKCISTFCFLFLLTSEEQKNHLKEFIGTKFHEFKEFKKIKFTLTFYKSADNP